jgi:amino acid transporter
MLNLICMILMCIVVFGVAIIFVVLFVEGTTRLKTSVLVHCIVPTLVLILNFYIVTLEEKAEYRFFSMEKGQFIMNAAFVASVLALFITLLLKVMEEGNSEDFNQEHQDSTMETSLTIEEYLIHTLAIIQTYSLKEYAESKLNDIAANAGSNSDD